MEHAASSENGISRKSSGLRLKEKLQVIRLSNVPGRVGAVVLTGGLILAMATDGDLSFLWSKILFSALFVVQIIVIDWLVR